MSREMSAAVINGGPAVRALLERREGGGEGRGGAGAACMFASLGSTSLFGPASITHISKLPFVRTGLEGFTSSTSPSVINQKRKLTVQFDLCSIFSFDSPC